MKRTLSLALASFILLSAFAGCAQTSDIPEDIFTGAPSEVPDDIVTESPSPYDVQNMDAPQYVQDYSQLIEHLGSRYAYETDALAPLAVLEEMAEAEAPASDDTVLQAGETAGDYSQTNVQVAGIDEGDIVKTDGRYIYVLHGNDLVIYEAAGADTGRLGSITLGYSEDTTEAGGYQTYYEYRDKSPAEMYVNGSTVIVISPDYYSLDWSTQEERDYEYSETVCLDFIDVSDPTSPALITSISQDGYLNTSRLYDGWLFLISRYYVYDFDESDPGTYVPCIGIDGVVTLLEPECIAVYPDCSADSYCVIGVYDARSGALSHAESLLGSGDTVYMSTGGIYLADNEYYRDAGEERTESVYKVTDYVSGSRTRITRYDISGGSVTLAASGSVPGYLNDQFSLDEHNGYLRVVTTVSTDSYSVYVDEERDFTNYVWDDSASFNGLYILDGGLATVGKVDGLAEDEIVYSARFDGDIAYFVTFRQTDPLFAVDLSDPSSPEVLSALKIPGFSEYLHFWSEGRLFGLGRDADEATGSADGIKLSMFDTSDPSDVREKCTLSLGQSYSEALYNHRAILISAEKNFIGFPADGSYMIYGYTDAEGFTKSAEIDCGESWSGARGLYIDDFAYIIGDAITVLDMTDFTLITTITIA